MAERKNFSRYKMRCGMLMRVDSCGRKIEEIELPIVVDAGIGRPSQACEAMEMGAAACLVNTGIASSDNPVVMAMAFRRAVEAGRAAYLAGAGAVISGGAVASSPLTGFLR